MRQLESESKNSFMREAIIGGIIILLILIIGTFSMGRSVSEDTKTAVRTVSMLYLGELAGRSEQVVADEINNYIADMDIAIGHLDKDTLGSEEKLHAYQDRMQKLYMLDKFALVDSEGLIHTSRGTRTDIERYHFDYKNITEPEVYIKNIDSKDKKVIIAAPVDNLPFQGKTFVACFIEIDMNNILNSVSLMSNSTNTTFCNLYNNDGISLANVVLDGLANDNNLFKALEESQFDEGYSLAGMVSDFSNGKKGIASFTYDNIKMTVCYVPVRETNWMLTFLIRESVISDQIGSITDEIIFRSLIQSFLTALILLILFTIAIVQTRRTAKIALEKEVIETETRVKQQELESQLALQTELLEQEKHRAEQDNMITSLASDYRSVYYVNLDADECICYRNDPKSNELIDEGERSSFRDTFKQYAERYVMSDYREGFLRFIEPDNIRRNLKEKAVITFRYLAFRNGKESYEMIRMADVKNATARLDKIVNDIGIGFADIDLDMRDSMAKSQALSDALRNAEEANRAKTVFLSSMSHEIRTPMNAIIGLDNLALNDSDIPESTKDYLEKIGTSAQHLLSLINDILDMSRIESGRMVIKNEEFSFSKLLEQINTMFGGQCHDKELDYNCRVNGTLDDYYIGDSMKLRQVLINVLGNAVKFTPRGGSIDFIVEKTASFGGKSTLKFIVKDTGIGINKEYLPKIFDTFSQEDGTSTNKYGSSGLGMAIAKNIVDMMNGKIEVESEKGVGTTFTVTVTLIDSANVDFDDDDITINPQEMSVLVVDDDPIACEHAKLVLAKAGIVSETVLDGAEAIEMVRLKHARRESYNLIIIDWHMPDPDGLEVTRQIRAIIGNETAIIMLTAYNWEEVMEDAVAAGVDSFIAKPLFTGNLLDELKNTLRKRREAQTIEKPKAELAGRRILLAEDMQVNAEIMMMVLGMRDMEVEHAENGKIALEMFEKSEPGYYSAILMDIRMPEMDGLEATQKIRALAREDAKTIPIIALTANAFDEDVQRSLQAGLNAHLTKPVDPEVLFDTLEHMIPA